MPPWVPAIGGLGLALWSTPTGSLAAYSHLRERSQLPWQSESKQDPLLVIQVVFHESPTL